jgi:hypothetical protein
MIRSLVALAFLAPTMAQADCYAERRGAGSGHYALKDGVVYDPRTNLSWARCSFGRQWAGVGCDGEPKRVTFDKARAAAEAAGDGWRLPTIRELASLIDRTCGAPAIDKVAFPDIAPNDEGKASYWSSSPAPEIPGMIYVVDFSDGDVDMHSTGLWLNLRLVRLGR